MTSKCIFPFFMFFCFLWVFLYLLSFCGRQILKMRVQELFTHGEGISTPCSCHKGRQPLIECAKHDFKIMYFPFLCLLFFPFYVFSFWGRQGYCPRSYVSLGVMRKSDLRSSLKSGSLFVKLIFIFLKD